MVTNTPCQPTSKDDDERTLLGFAAKAAGILLAHWNDGGECYSSGPGFILPSNAIWNPLTDDGDALRLAVRLGIEYVYGYGLDDEVQRVIVYDDLHVMVQDGDVCAAVRLAIVRAAAEIGKAMK